MSEEKEREVLSPPLFINIFVIFLPPLRQVRGFLSYGTALRSIVPEGFPCCVLRGGVDLFCQRTRREMSDNDMPLGIIP